MSGAEDLGQRIDELIQLSRELIDNSVEFDVDGFERYASSLQRLLTETSAEFPAELEEALGKLNLNHSILLERAQKATSLAGGDLRSFKERGKGILKYVDTLPKRISSRRGRKG